jgi:hypothetical protein
MTDDHGGDTRSDRRVVGVVNPATLVTPLVLDSSAKLVCECRSASYIENGPKEIHARKEFS